MDKDTFNLWVKKILETEDEEISCSECFDFISGYVDLELAGKGNERIMRPVANHLKQCPACQQEYEVLRELARMESSGKFPT